MEVLRKCIYELKYTAEWNADAENKIDNAKNMRLFYKLNLHTPYI
jgi:hypothetical protein